MEADAEPVEADPVPAEADPVAEEAVSAASVAAAETAALSDRDGQRLISTQMVQHDYLTLNGKVAGDTITVDGTVTTVMDFIYDESGRPFALKYSDDGGKSFDTYYYVLNLQGDVVKLVWYIPGFEYEAVATYTYDAWGSVTATTAAGNTPATTTLVYRNPIRYRGYVYDNETGFYYLQSRYYDPANHRFINADAYASTGQGFTGTNMFAYCNNSPVNCSDPTGQWTFTLTFLSASITAFLFGAEVSIGISVDDDWNVGLQWSYALPPYIDEETFIAGTPAAGASSPVQWTEVDTIQDLEGPGFNAGFSAGYLWYSWGGDFISTGDELVLKDGDINGLQTGSGVGVGMDIHVAVSKTETIWKVNLKDLFFRRQDERD